MGHQTGLDVDEIERAVMGRATDKTIFSPYYNWNDKPHRVAQDLCREIRELRIEKECLRKLLIRVDQTTAWETHPLGRGFQDEIEAIISLADLTRP